MELLAYTLALSGQKVLFNRNFTMPPNEKGLSHTCNGSIEFFYKLESNFCARDTLAVRLRFQAWHYI